MLIIVTCWSNAQLILKFPLFPLFQRGRALFPLFGKRGVRGDFKESSSFELPKTSFANEKRTSSLIKGR